MRGTKLALGILLGIKQLTQVEIHNAFETPISEDTQIFDADFLRQRQDQCWYAVKALPHNASDIQQQLAAIQPDPVAVLLHASEDAYSRAQKTGGLPIECFVTRDRSLHSVSTSLSTSSAEHVVLKDANEHMQRNDASQGDNSATLAAVMAERDAVQTLHERICEIKTYVDQVKDGTRPHNDEILRKIAAAVANQGYEKASEHRDTIYEGPSSYLADLTNNLHTLHEVRPILTQASGAQ